MNIRLPMVLSLAFVVIGFSAIDLKASDPAGIFAVVDKVVFEPSESAPQRIQVWGAFAISDAKPGDNYQPSQRGYLYFTLQPGKEEICKKEWADLKAVAGTGQVVAFASKYNFKARFHKADEKPATPDLYPVSMGVTKVGAARLPAVIAPLKAVPVKPR